ncbi:MAG: Imm63 family immunity protein [Lutisporaceae bacterium]
MGTISTNELEANIRVGYSKLRTMAEKDKIYAKLNVLFTNTLPLNFEGMYAYADKGGYHYATIERGIMNMHKITDDLFEISYWIYSYATFNMAVEYEYRNRRKNRDTRRLYFQKQLELLELIGTNYRERGETEIEEILKTAPYDDSIF